MPVMTRMRDSMPVILFGLLIAFLITIIFEWGMDYLGISGGRTDAVGEINGRKVSYQNFTELVRIYADNEKARTGQEPDEAQLRAAREEVWERVVTQYLLEEEIERLGLRVTDQELIDWVRGDNPPEDLRRNFVDSLGQFRRDIYEQFLSNPNQFITDPQGLDPNFGTKWLVDFENTLRQRRLQEKIQSLILASVRVTEGEIRERFLNQNQRFNTVFAQFDPSTMVPDEEVQVTDKDLRAYYESHLNEYKVEASRKLSYVLFLEAASAEDSAARKREIEDVAARAKRGVDFLDLVYTYSDRPDSGLFFKHGELSPVLEQPVFAANVGDVVGPILDNDGYHLIKVLEERKGDTEYAHAAHILLRFEEAEEAEVRKKAMEILRDARAGKDFAELAQQHSQDASNAPRGGDLGWFPKGRMVREFEEAVFKAKRGDVVGPIRTQFGFHIIKVFGRDSRELKIANIKISIAPGPQTRNQLFDRSVDFAHNARESEFVKEANASGFSVRETQIQERGGVIPGIGVNESINRWAFQNKVGSVSDPFTIQSGYAVFAIREAKEAGVQPFDEVKESIRPLVVREKKIDKAMELARAARAQLQPGDSVAVLASVNAAIKIVRTGPFTVLTSGIVGRDPDFLGALTRLSEGEISEPVRALRGAVIIQLVSKTPFDSTMYSSTRSVLRNQILQEKSTRSITEWVAQLKKDADIVDKRDLFFR